MSGGSPRSGALESLWSLADDLYDLYLRTRLSGRAGARAAGSASSLMTEAWEGRLPSLDALRAHLQECGVQEFGAWALRWEQTRRQIEVEQGIPGFLLPEVKIVRRTFVRRSRGSYAFALPRSLSYGSRSFTAEFLVNCKVRDRDQLVWSGVRDIPRLLVTEARARLRLAQRENRDPADEFGGVFAAMPLTRGAGIDALVSVDVQAVPFPAAPQQASTPQPYAGPPVPQPLHPTGAVSQQPPVPGQGGIPEGVWPYLIPPTGPGNRLSPVPAPEADRSRERFLVADMAPAVRLGSTCSLVVSILADRPVDSVSAARSLQLPPAPGGVALTVVVHPSSGLLPEDALEQVVQVPPDGDSAPVRFPFQAVQEGLQRVRLTAWVGGSFLCELEVQVSVHASARVAGAPRRAVAAMESLEPAQGEVTLQITTIDGRPAFQIISEPYLGRLVHAESLVGAAGDAVERAISTLRDLAVGRSPYSAGTARRWMEEVGAGLWRQMVPDVVKDEFWQLRDRITTFTIAADDDIPWELLYPLAPGHDEGFLVEAFPVLRRARGQGRTRSLQLSDPRFVVSARQPVTAAEEIAAIQGVIGPGAVIDSIEGVLDALDAGELNVAHFACHNAFQLDGGGSRIEMAGGQLVPGMLNRAAVRRSLAARSPVVFLNACRSAGAVPEYTQMMGWAQQFLSAGAGAFLGTLWAVRSDKASSFATTFYTALAEGRPLGQAVLAARRQAAAGDGDPTWLAYTAYGDPAATASATTP